MKTIRMKSKMNRNKRTRRFFFLAMILAMLSVRVIGATDAGALVRPASEPPTMSSPLPVLSLDSALAHVAARNPELRIWEEKAQARSAQAEGAKAWMPPELGVGGSQLPYGSGEAANMAPGDPALMVSFRQMIPGPGKRESHARYLTSLALRERAGGAWMRTVLLADAKIQYFKMAAAERRLAVLAEGESVMSYMLKVAETRFRHRQTDLATVQEAKARLLELGSMRLMEKATEKSAAAALSTLMADSALFEYSVDTALSLRGYALLPPDSVKVAARSDLAQIDATVQSMRLNVEWMSRQGRPDFGIQFDHMEMFDMGRRYSVMGMMTLPLAPWSGGMIRSEVRSMQKDLQSMGSERAAHTLMALRMAREMQVMLKSEVDQLGQYDGQIVPAYRMGLDAAMAGYQEGTGDLFRVLDTWDHWVMARMTALEHFGKALVLEAEYERETGKL